MRTVGFSTGALALADFRRGVRILVEYHVDCVELSALRLEELPKLVDGVDDLDLSSFSYISIHAPSAFRPSEERRVVAQIERLLHRNWPIVIHPDTVSDWHAWLGFGSLLLVENMDKRKSRGRSLLELQGIFDQVPEAGLCFDIAHARQFDPSMTEAGSILRELGGRLRQIHVSEVSTSSRHARLSRGAVLAFQEVAHLIPSEIAVIIEAPVKEPELKAEIDMVLEALPEIQAGVRSQ